MTILKLTTLRNLQRCTDYDSWSVLVFNSWLKFAKLPLKSQSCHCIEYKPWSNLVGKHRQQQCRCLQGKSLINCIWSLFKILYLCLTSFITAESTMRLIIAMLTSAASHLKPRNYVSKLWEFFTSKRLYILSLSY